MKLSYQKINGTLYAKIPGKSVRKNGKVVKQGAKHLGKVIDKENNVFYNKKQGMFTYDPETGEYGKADESYISDVRPDNRKRKQTILDYGDAYFIDSLIHQMGYDQVIDKIGYKNKDTLYAMIAFYVLTNSANCYASTWYEGSFESLLYPRANLTSQRISDFLKSIGNPENILEYFKNHMNWIKDNISDDKAIIIDSTGLPNSIHMPLTAISTHNGKVSKEARMITTIQRDSGFPLMFRLIPGNIVDMSTLIRSVNVLDHIGKIDTDFILSDAGYYTTSDINELYDANIDFLMRLPEKYNLYKDLVKKYGSNLKNEENIVKYNDRTVYIKQIEVTIGAGHTAYAFLGYDLERANDEMHKFLAKCNDLTPAQIQKKIESMGYFVLISSLPFATDGILPAYYTRQIVEQYFDLSKGSSKLTPLRVHSEDTLRGHLLLSMIAATINVYIQRKTHNKAFNQNGLFMGLRNQKCLVYKTVTTVCEAQKKANDMYKAFDMDCPLSYTKRNEKWVTKYQLDKRQNEA